MSNSMGFRTKYDYQPDYSKFENPPVLEGMGSLWDDIKGAADKAWESNKDKLEDKAKEEFSQAIDKYGQPLIDDLYKEAITTADKYLTADEKSYQESKKRLESLTRFGSATAFDSVKQAISDNKWVIVGGTVGAMFLFGLVGYGFASYATKRS